MSAARAASRSAKAPCARGPGLSPRFRRRRHASSAWAAAQQRRGAGDVGVRAAARRAHVCARGGLGAVRRGARPPLLLARARRRSRACVSWPSCVRRHRRLAAAVRVGLELASCAAAFACAAVFGPSAAARAWPPLGMARHGTCQAARAPSSGFLPDAGFSPAAAVPWDPTRRARRSQWAVRRWVDQGACHGLLLVGVARFACAAGRGVRAGPCRARRLPVPPPLGLPPDTLGAHTAAAVTQWRPFGAGGELRCSTTLV